MLKGMILAAGVGSRLQPLTDNCPKPMLPIGNKPVLEHIINWLQHYQIKDIALNLYHLPEKITNHFGDGTAHGVQFHYSTEKTILGTAGALTSFNRFLDTPFVVVYGDVITNLDLDAMLAFHRRQQAAITLALYQVDDPSRCGLVDTDEQGRVRRFIEKPDPAEIFTDLANGGIYLVEPEILSYIPAGQFYDFGHDLFPKLLTQNIPIYGYSIGDAYLIDMGTHETYEQAKADHLHGKF